MRKRVILDNVQNVAWALVFAIALWLVMVQSQQRSAQIPAYLTVEATGGINVKYLDATQRAIEKVTVKGSAGDIAAMSRNVQGVYRVPEADPMGVRKFQAKDFEFRLGPGLEVDKAALTAEVDVELAKEKAGRLAIELNFDEKLPEGWELDGVPTIEPRELDAVGPIDVMSRKPEPRLRTEPISLESILQKFDFDPNLRREYPCTQKVNVFAPPDTGISFRGDAKLGEAKFSFKVRPKPRDVDIELSPSFHFAGPVFPGVPFKLKPRTGQRVTLHISGPELDLLDTTIEATKAAFTVIGRPKAEFFEKNKLKVGAILRFDITVIPPPGIRIITGPEPKELLYDVIPMDPEDGSSEK